MAELNCGFELGRPGVTVATTDPGDGDAWDTISIAANGTCIYDTIHTARGAYSCKIATGATAAGVTLRWDTKFGTQTDHDGRLYCFFTANPGSTLVLIDARTASARGAGVQLLSTGKLATLDSAGTVQTFTNSVGLNAEFRIEYHFIHSTTVGQVEVKLFNTATSSTPTETQTSAANRNTLASVDRILFGMNSSVANAGPFWIDSIRAAATAYPGPAPAGFSRGLLGRVGR